MLQSLRIILVHGTWGRGFFAKKPVAPWCEQNSPFVRSLSDELVRRKFLANISSFNWSGNNSIFERATAAAQLKDVIESYSADEPVLLVAHSHGGNIALRAASELKDVSNVYVCTMATPFLRIFVAPDRKFEEAGPLFLGLSLFSIGLPIFVFVARNPYSPVASSALGIMVLIAAFVFCVIASVVIGYYLYKLLVNEPEFDPGFFGEQERIAWEETQPAWERKPRLLSQATTSDTSLLDDRLLVLRGIDDEASLVLAAGATTNRLMRLVYAFVFGKHFVRILLMIGFANVTLIILSYKQIAYWLFSSLMFLLGFAAVGPLLAIVASCLARAVFGREMVTGALRCDASFESTPDSSHVYVRTIQSVGAGDNLFHSLYQNPMLPQIIASWITNDPLELRIVIPYDPSLERGLMNKGPFFTPARAPTPADRFFSGE